MKFLRDSDFPDLYRSLVKESDSTLEHTLISDLRANLLTRNRPAKILALISQMLAAGIFSNYLENIQIGQHWKAEVEGPEGRGGH